MTMMTTSNIWRFQTAPAAVVVAPKRFFVKSMEDRKEEKDAKAFREDI